VYFLFEKEIHESVFHFHSPLLTIICRNYPWKCMRCIYRVSLCLGSFSLRYLSCNKSQGFFAPLHLSRSGLGKKTKVFHFRMLILFEKELAMRRLESWKPAFRFPPLYVYTVFFGLWYWGTLTYFRPSLTLSGSGLLSRISYTGSLNSLHKESHIDETQDLSWFFFEKLGIMYEIQNFIILGGFGLLGM